MSPAEAIIYPLEGDGDEQDDKNSNIIRGSKWTKPRNRKSQADAASNRSRSHSHHSRTQGQVGGHGHGSDLNLTNISVTAAPAATSSSSSSSSPTAPPSAVAGLAPSHESYPPTTARPTTSTNSKPSKVFQFVDANPSTDAQRFQNKVLVRSNASNYHWRRARKSTHPHSDVDVPGQLGHGHVKAKLPSPATKRPSTSNTQSSGWLSNLSSLTHITSDEEQQDDFFNSSDHALRLLNPDRRTSETTPYLPSSHISGHHDPFEMYPSDLPKEFVSPVLDQLMAFMTFIFPPRPGAIMSDLTIIWMKATFNDWALFHGSLFCQLTRNKAFLGYTAETSESVQCYTETIRGVHRRFLENGPASSSDENILSVYSLAYHGVLRSVSAVKGPNQGPLEGLAMLNVYGGQLEAVHVHLQGLAKMINLRGGIHKLQFPGLAQAISYGDVIMATQALTKPLHPFISINPALIPPLRTTPLDHPLRELGQAFLSLATFDIDVSGSKLLVVLRWITQHTICIDDYVHGRPESYSTLQMSQQRSFVQHGLMLLAPSESGHEMLNPLHRLCWMATVVFCLLVTYPIPAVAAPFHRLAADIRLWLSHPQSRELYPQVPSFILWVMVMGAIASIGSNERQWYLKALAHMTKAMSIMDWFSLRDIMTTFLWYGDTNDIDGLNLWQDISPLRQLTVSHRSRRR
ncbi:hypothetical protein B0A52_09144 [Exophiala mesophila]|uniref:Transcription factor domain-containing protein n=1 Tax=Exophiala mesophila TaxID=212818 RepID=A0A438MWT1_EXOME|nr:hypothetical protein B0A52_09144 [Exophiala mesophila]